MDDKDTLKRFKTELKAPFTFIPDPEGKVVGLYDVKTPMVSFAKRYSFVVGQDRKIIKIQSGQDAVNPDEAIAACPLKKKEQG